MNMGLHVAAWLSNHPHSAVFDYFDEKGAHRKSDMPNEYIDWLLQAIKEKAEREGFSVKWGAASNRWING